MRGQDARQAAMFGYVSLEERICAGPPRADDDFVICGSHRSRFPAAIAIALRPVSGLTRHRTFPAPAR